MALALQPKEGTIVACDFSGFRVPEMTKTRPVVVLQRNPGHHQLVTVVPLSSGRPQQIMPCHYEFPQSPLPNAEWPLIWAKCDMVATVSLDRLHIYGGRMYRDKNVHLRVTDTDFQAIQAAVASALGLTCRH